MARPSRKNMDADTPSARDQLLDATGALMTEQRTIDISLAEIAERSGLNSALVKYYFGSKNGLLVALLRKVLGPRMAELEPLTHAPAAPNEKLRIHINGVVNTYFKYPYVNRLMHYLMTEAGQEYGRIIAEEFARPLVDTQTAILKEGQAQGLFLETDPLMFYFHLVGACDYLFFGRATLDHVFGVQEVTQDLKRRYVDHIYQTLTKGLAPV